MGQLTWTHFCSNSKKPKNSMIIRRIEASLREDLIANLAKIGSSGSSTPDTLRRPQGVGPSRTNGSSSSRLPMRMAPQQSRMASSVPSPRQTGPAQPTKISSPRSARVTPQSTPRATPRTSRCVNYPNHNDDLKYTQYPIQGIPIQRRTLKPYLVSDVTVTT